MKAVAQVLQALQVADIAAAGFEAAGIEAADMTVVDTQAELHTAAAAVADQPVELVVVDTAPAVQEVAEKAGLRTVQEVAVEVGLRIVQEVAGAV
jgi:hypothetical protein